MNQNPEQQARGNIDRQLRVCGWVIQNENDINLNSSPGIAVKEVWDYDCRSNIYHTLKKNPLKLDDLREFITLYNPENRHKRKKTYHPESNPEGRWRRFNYDELISRDKTSLYVS